MGWVEWYKGASYARLRIQPRHTGHRHVLGEYGPELVPGRAAHEGTGQYWQSAKRGAVIGFSRHSRKRLLALVHQVDFAGLGYLPKFITLTYPDSFPTDWRVVKRHTDAFHHAFERKYGKRGCIWKREFQLRGAPHVHLMVFMPEYVDRVWVAQSWYRIVGSGDPAHLQAGTEVRAVQSVGHCMAYVAKYMAKECDDAASMAGTGRWWGVRNKALIPRERCSSPLTHGEWYAYRRFVATYLRKHGARSPRLGERGTASRPAVCEPGRVGVSAYIPWQEQARYVEWLTRGRPRLRVEPTRGRVPGEGCLR